VKIKREPRAEEPNEPSDDDRLDWDVQVEENDDGSLSFVVSPVLFYEQVDWERGLELRRAPRRRRVD